MLNGELYPYVEVRDVGRDRIEGASVGNPTFTYGSASPTMPQLRGPGLNNFDLSLFKSFRVREKVSAQFRFESFNTFNRVQFAKPGLQAGSTAFGVITVQQNQPRKLQLALKLIF